MGRNQRQENLDQWRSYFQELLNIGAFDQYETVIVAAPEDPLIETADFSFQEIFSAIGRLKNGKASGSDGAVTPESVRYGGKVAATSLLNMCTKILNGSAPPRQWLTNIVIPIPKKGNHKHL